MAARRHISADELRVVLHNCGQNRTRAAERLGISRRYLYKLMERDLKPLEPLQRPKSPRKRPPDEPWPPPPPTDEVERADWDLTRDLSTCTYDEMQTRWQTSRRGDAVRLLQKPWDELVPADHNPAYFIAEKCWFDNVAGKKWEARYLYKPYHLKRLCEPAVKYLNEPESPEAGMLWIGTRHSFKSTFFQGVIPMHRQLRMHHLFGIDILQVLRHHKEKMASKNLLRYKRKFMHHPWVRKYWPEACPPPNCKDFGTSTEFTLAWVPQGSSIAEASVRAIGVTGTDTGSHGHEDYNDDLVTEDHRTSKKIRDESLEKYAARQFQREPGEGKEINSGTPYHPRDLWAKMRDAKTTGDGIEDQPTYRVFINHARCDHAEGAFKGCDGKPGDLALPYRLTDAFLEKQRQFEINLCGNDDMHYLQYQCEPKLTRTTTTDLSWIRQVDQHEIPPCFTVITVDGAWKGTHNQGEGDSASIQVWGMERRGGVILRYLLDGVHSNEMSSADGEQEIFRLMAKWGCRHVAPEEHGGVVFSTQLRNTAIALGVSLIIIRLKMRFTQKDRRIVGFIKEAEAGRVLVSSSCSPELWDPKSEDGAFKLQFRDYTGPDSIEHDDALDAAAYTCDPNILDAWVPQWNSYGENEFVRPPWIRPHTPPAQEPRRTRYTLI